MALYRPEGPKDVPLRSLQDLCLLTMIDNLDLLSDVGDTDLLLLEKVLVHCNAEQLETIEVASEPRDLSSVTNDLWLRLYGLKWGQESVQKLTARLNKLGLPLRWRALYHHKVKEQEETQNRCVNRLRELFIKERNERESRRTLEIRKLPNAGKRKKPVPGNNFTSSLSNLGQLMKKAKLEASREAALWRSSSSSSLHRKPGSSPQPSRLSSSVPVKERPPQLGAMSPPRAHSSGRSNLLSPARKDGCWGQQMPSPGAARSAGQQASGSVNVHSPKLSAERGKGNVVGDVRLQVSQASGSRSPQERRAEVRSPSGDKALKKCIDGMARGLGGLGTSVRGASEGLDRAGQERQTGRAAQSSGLSEQESIGAASGGVKRKGLLEQVSPRKRSQAAASVNRSQQSAAVSDKPVSTASERKLRVVSPEHTGRTGVKPKVSKLAALRKKLK